MGFAGDGRLRMGGSRQLSFVPCRSSSVIRPLSFVIFPSSAVSCRLSVASCQQQASCRWSVVSGSLRGCHGPAERPGSGRMGSVSILGTCDLSSWASRGNHGFHVNAHLSKARLAYYLKIRNIQQVPPLTDPIKSASDGNALASQMRLAGLLILPRVEGNFHVRRRVRASQRPKEPSADRLLRKPGPWRPFERFFPEASHGGACYPLAMLAQWRQFARNARPSNRTD